MMQDAVWVECPGMKNEFKAGHSLRDHCWSCAPFWEQFPTCPHCGGKLGKLGKTKCRGCGRFVMVRPRAKEGA